MLRIKEVAIKKLMGSSKKQLLLQYVIESFILCSIASILALIFILLFSKGIDKSTGIDLDIVQMLTIQNIFFFVLFFIVIVLVSGLVPAIKIVELKPLDVIQGKLRHKSKRVYTKYFVIFQFIITICLLSSSWVIVNQTSYLKSKELGFKTSDVIWIEYLGTPANKKSTKSSLSSIPGVELVSIVWGSPIDGGSNQSFDYDGRPISMQEISVDSTFFRLFEIKKNTHSKVAKDPKGVYLNKSALKELGIDSLATNFKMNKEIIPILGIVEDFNFEQLRYDIAPLMIRQQSEDFYANKVLLSESDITNILGIIENIRDVYQKKFNNSL